MVAPSGGADALATILRSARVVQHHADAEPLRLVRWTPPQRQWLSCKAPRKLLRAGNQCLGGEVEVSTPSGPRRMDSLADGDIVYAYDEETGEIVPAPIAEVTRGEPEILYRVDLANGASFTATAEHRVLTTTQAWLPVSALNTRDVLEGLAFSRRTRVASVTPDRVDCHYTMSVAGLHTYVAAGVVHANCGKTWAGMAEVIWRSLGTHPYVETRKPPVEIWVVCTSWSQSVAIMGKFWALVPKHQIKPSTRFDARYGFGRDNPSVIFLNGSIVRFRTTNQGPEALAGATIDYVHVDEPCDEDVYRELDRRVLRRGGQVGITLTPINRPCEWLHDLVTQGAVEEVHATLTQANLTPVGSKSPMRLLDGTPMDEAWIAEQRRITPATYAPVVLDGEWETSPEGVFFDCFDSKRHISGRMSLDPRRGAIRWVLGIDYAAADRLFGLCAVLCQVQSYRDEKGHTREAVVACDEVTLPGAASTIEFARALLLMLDRNGIRWTDLAHAHGDNPVESRFVPKSNVQTRKALAVEMGVPYEAVKIRNAKDHLQSAGSFDSSCRYLYEVIASGRFIVHPRCETLIRALTTWDLKRTHPMKDVIDALRYALKPYAFPSERARSVNVLLG